MAQPGYIYILINQSLPDLIKIGRTNRDPEDRARELSSATGVASPFRVVYYLTCLDSCLLEKNIHSRLDSFRVSNNREFFKIPVPEAINVLIEEHNQIGNLSQSTEFSKETGLLTDDTQPICVTRKEKSFDAPGKELFEIGNDYLYGNGDTLQDCDEAYSYFIKASKLGFPKAFDMLGDMTMRGLGCKANRKKGIDFYLKAVSSGYDFSWAKLARNYFYHRQIDNEEKCWAKFFTSIHFHDYKEELPDYLSQYLLNCVMLKRSIYYREQIVCYRDETLAFIRNLAIKEFTYRTHRYYELRYTYRLLKNL